MTTTIEALGQRACQAKKVVAKLPTNLKNETLCRVANDLVANQAAQPQSVGSMTSFLP